jgi:hypothetical protein
VARVHQHFLRHKKSLRNPRAAAKLGRAHRAPMGWMLELRRSTTRGLAGAGVVPDLVPRVMWRKTSWVLRLGPSRWPRIGQPAFWRRRGQSGCSLAQPWTRNAESDLQAPPCDSSLILRPADFL